MKRHLLLTALLCMTALGIYAQRSYTFNAVALNVDGLPNEDISVLGLTTVNLNKDGKNETGATEFCNILANSGWDIVGLSEDFNFHSYIAGSPASTYYDFGKHSGSISTNLSQAFSRAKIDGLGIAVAKHMTFTGDTSTGLQTQWEKEYGGGSGTTVGDNGADNMITKGFRMYTVTLATGVAVDVYILHMDASTADSDDDYENGKDKNVIARESQLTQLATYIKNNHNNRPVIILGDTNCRYTREQLKTLFIDVINADARFTIEDAWVELMWGGAYPTYGGESMMTDAYGMQKGEIVDKVFYINTTESDLTLKANSYLHDESVTVSDHCPVVVNFTLTDPNGEATGNSSWQVNGGVIVEDENMLDGCQVTDGTTYYIKNVSTGLYLNSGAVWGTQACEGSAGMPITVTLSDGKYRLGTLKGSVSAVETPFMDNGDNTTWILQEVANTQYQYYLKINDTQALSSTGEQANANSTEDYIVSCKAFNANDDKQKWVLLTEERMKEEMTSATASKPFDVTPLLKAAGFDRMDAENSYASTNWPGLSFSYWQNEQAAVHNGSAQYVSTSALTVSQVLSAMPAGTYTVSFEGFYRAQAKKNSWSSSVSDYSMSVPVSFGGSYGISSINLKQNTGLDINGDARWTFLDNDSWLTSFDVTTTAKGDMTLKIAVPKFSSGSSSSRNSWIAIDNFAIKYKGDGSEEENALSVKTMVGNYINLTAQKVAQLNTAGQAAYDITNVLYRYNNNLLSSDGQAEVEMIDAAYEAALIAHKRALVEEAFNNSNGDVTSLIVNPSFETGDVTGWTIGTSGWDKGAQLNSNATFTTEGCDGNYLFNSYGGDDGHTGNIQQTIKGIPNGLYELKVKVTSFADRYVYIVGNGYHSKVATTQAKTVFHEATLYFLVEDGTATIGVVGGNKGGGSTFIHYWPWEGCFFKADNFRLKYICDVPHGRLKLALMDAENAALDAYGKSALNITTYQNAYNNKSLTTDGKTEATAVYTALQTAAKAQKTAGADMTWTIENPSFETGNYTGWTVTAIWDTGAYPQENGTFTVAGTDGRYLFNIWDAGKGNPITQTVTGIPNGTYKLTAMVSSDNGNSLMLTGNGTSTTIAASTNGASSGVFPEVECTVTDGTLAITVEGADGVWYKCDDFHLTLVSPSELRLSETATVIEAIENVSYSSVILERTIKGQASNGSVAWSSFVAPFDIEGLDGWEYKELTGATYNESSETLSLTFSTASSIKAGKPYMIRCTTLGTGKYTELPLGTRTVNTVTKNDTEVTITNGNGSKVIFKGVYTAGNVPQGAFFISDNTFYQAADGTNTIKGFRAYLEISGDLASKARSMSFRWDDDETTSIDNGQLTNDNEVTTVAIYDINGVRLSQMQPGINILLMSDGSTIKVMVK